jgi:hypothetical protein
MQATGLELIGVDFLVEAGQPYLTDINSTQGLWSFEAGCKALFEYLLRRLDEPMTSQQRSNA